MPRTRASTTAGEAGCDDRDPGALGRPLRFSKGQALPLLSFSYISIPTCIILGGSVVSHGHYCKVTNLTQTSVLDADSRYPSRSRKGVGGMKEPGDGWDQQLNKFSSRYRRWKEALDSWVVSKFHSLVGNYGCFFSMQEKKGEDQGE